MLGPWPLLPGRGPVRPDVEQKAGSDDGRRFGGWCLYGGFLLRLFRYVS